MEISDQVTSSEAAEKLRGLSETASAIAEEQTAKSPRELKEAYLNWALSAERVIGELTQDDSADRILSDRHWRIRAEADDSTHCVELIISEIHSQCRWLNRIQQSMTAQIARFQAREGTAFILDSNIFLQFQLFTDIDWREALGAEKVRIIVPLKVLTELDDKKTSPKNSLRKRAQRVIVELGNLLENSASSPAVLSEDVTIEVLDRTGTATSPVNADDAILDEARYVSQMLENPITVVSDDTGVRLRASQRGLRTLRLEDKYRPVDTSDGREDSSKVKMKLLFHENSQFLDPGSSTTKIFEIESEMAEVIGDREPLAMPGRRAYSALSEYSASDAEEYNRKLDDWYQEVREWAEKCERVCSVRYRAVELPLILVNSDKIPIGDIRLQVSIRSAKDALKFSQEDDFKLPESPQPPQKPSRFGINLFSNISGIQAWEPSLPIPGVESWQIEDDRRVASITLEQVRQGQSLPVPDSILVCHPVPGEAVGGFEIEWELLTSQPPGSNRGKLQVRPRRENYM
ncbi:PIN domain-containing protein [Streptomyces sp. NPDC048172]|uniref:PIN domain-containing protein n=1 Tax=Streptomyces sp. NPDC048172 TaxID=3365505 RepID=UPI003724608B